ncbi:hypothetical protein FM21_23195 [Streptomyces mutabilis]|uniref:Uncharacterized protein n=1 Tax=Streptomyces mutabilis TaxID=67332 RepID=A0A086MXT2_9ACTN|nr:hypothetical protein FM21_23195 [Streptomyces mutabilis]
MCLSPTGDETEQTQKAGEAPKPPPSVIIVLLGVVLRCSLRGLHVGFLGHHRRLRFHGGRCGSREESGGQDGTDSHASHGSSFCASWTGSSTYGA